MHDKFLVLAKKHEVDLQKISSVFNIIGYVKLSLIAFIGLVIYLAFRNSFALWCLILLITTFVVSVAFWVYHAMLSRKVDYLKGIIAVYNQQICRINGQWVNFKDIGAEFIDPNHPYACDLDIVGKKSLFQFLNTTHTWHGRQAFASGLLHPTYNKPELEKKQEAISELSRDVDFSSKIQYCLSKIGVDPYMPAFIECIKNSTTFCKHKSLRIMLAYIPMLTLLFIAGIVIFQQRHLFIVGAAAVLVQLIVWAGGASKAHMYLAAVVKLPYKLGTYKEVIDVLVKQNFKAEKLTQTQAKLREAESAIKDLSKIADKVSVQHNVILYFLANIFLLWDYYCAFLLQEWKLKYAHVAESWFLTIGEFESMLSLSHLPNICNNTSLPILDDKMRAIEAKDIGHPLLLNENRVNNDFHFRDNIYIISGSNMSGKTTFLRTIGINIVLARAGSFVCAGKMQSAILGVATSMRLADDLNEGVSTFYAELKRIKMIIALTEAQPNTIFLIDEIFRGTNSVDRLAGARGVIARLNNLSAIGLLSTHDLELCALERAHERIKNYSFCERYTDDGLSFDYKIKDGKSNTTNAKYLMKMVGIVKVR